MPPPRCAETDDMHDDRARTLFAHLRDRGLAHVERAAQVHVQHRVVVLGLDIHEFERLRDAGVVDEHVDPAEFTNDPLGGAQARLLVDDIAGETEMALAEAGRSVPGLTFVEVQNDDSRTLLGEQASGRQTDSARRRRSRENANFIG